MPNTQLAIDVRGLSRTFKGKTAVDNISLSIPKGQIYGFLGPNGAGKSTFVKMLVTLLSPTSGEAKILGKDIKTQGNDARLKIGVALQEASLDESQTGIEFLKIQGNLYGLTAKEIESRIEELKPLIDIGDALGKPIKTYSGGMKRRVDLAASIIHNPEILFLDEPTTGLDPVSRQSIWKEVQKLNKELGMTIFLTTQYLEEADQLADKIGIINQGKLVLEGTPEELKKSVGKDIIIASVEGMKDAQLASITDIPGVDKAELQGNELSIVTGNGSDTIGAVAIALDKQKVKINSLTLRSTTLDDVFFEVTGNRIETE
jgi:ABC-2 type transport system ATP-binding protein